MLYEGYMYSYKKFEGKISKLIALKKFIHRKVGDFWCLRTGISIAVALASKNRSVKPPKPFAPNATHQSCNGIKFKIIGFDQQGKRNIKYFLCEPC